MRHCNIRGCALALAAMLWSSASFAQQPTPLHGWFQLPPMCSSVAAIRG